MLVWIARAFGAAAAILLLFLGPHRAQADEIAIGGQIFVGSENHTELDNNVAARIPIPFVVLDARLKRFQITGELVPPLTASTNSVAGIHSVQLSYLDGSARYWIGGRIRWCVGLGQTLWNQRTEYIETPIQYDASRGAGARFEVGNEVPVLRRDSIETILAVSPKIHATLSYTFGSLGYAEQPVSEQEAQVDTQVALVQPAGTWKFKYGVRYLNMTAKFDDGSFADANHVVGLFVTALYRFNK
jgi:hypothetical protein